MSKPIERGATARKKSALLCSIIARTIIAFSFVADGFAADNHQAQDRDVWFVHATDPHLFIPTRNEKKDNQDQNQRTFSDLLDVVGSLPGGQGPSAFLVLTGDLGVDPCDIFQASNPASLGQNQALPGRGSEENETDGRSPGECVQEALAERGKREKQMDQTAGLLSKSRLPNIYLVAGNNDIADESAGDEAIKYFNDFIDGVQAKLAANKSNVHLYNLTRCYQSGQEAATCSADIPNADYRLIGFPSYSFKNNDENAQAKQFQIFRQLLKDAALAGKKVLVISHTPDIDDPFALAQDRYVNSRLAPIVPSTSTAAATPAKKERRQMGGQNESEPNGQTEAGAAEWRRVASWKVSDKLLREWKDALASESVIAVLAGHLHDSHKEIYRQPYGWSNLNEYRTSLHKLFLAPPLAVKNQVTSPIQARGFSLVHLRADRVESRFFWYNSETHAFTADSQLKHRWLRRGVFGRLCHRVFAAAAGLWSLDKTETALVRTSVLLIALLTAFLTVVAIWQIPPPSDAFANDKKTTNGTSQTTPVASNTAVDSSPFVNRFGKTVIGGLSGLVVTEVAKALGNQQSSADTRWYYLIWFILFFFFLLIVLNVWRSLVEGLRATVAVAYYPLPRVGRVTKSTWDRFKDWSSYRLSRAFQWLSSMRVPVLTGFDTFINLIQGKNQSRTQVFEKTIIEQQWNVIRVADRIRSNLNHFIEGQVRAKRQEIANSAGTSAGNQSTSVRAPDLPGLVRVNISVLSKDQTNVYYISRSSGSSHSPFPRRSMAWLSVFTGENRWYQSAYRTRTDFDQIVLFDNASRLVPGDEAKFLLRDHYQVRPDEDYHAFVVIPVPSPRRGFGSNYVKGAIHVSFRDEADLSFIWKTVEMTPQGAPPAYPTEQRLLGNWCIDPGIRAALNNSVAVLGELLRGFNEVIYKSYIEANQPD